MSRCILCLLLFAFSSVATAQTTQDDQLAKDSWAEKTKRDCLEQQQGAIQNATVPDRIIVSFCMCLAERVREVITANDVTRTGPTPEFQHKLNGIGMVCAHETFVFR